MKPNVGGIDRIFRFLLGVAIILAGLYYHSWWGIFGIIPLATAALRFCPAYLLLGFSTCDCKKK